jgi:hypothetical protein
LVKIRSSSDGVCSKCPADKLGSGFMTVEHLSHRAGIVAIQFSCAVADTGFGGRVAVQETRDTASLDSGGDGAPPHGATGGRASSPRFYNRVQRQPSSVNVPPSSAKIAHRRDTSRAFVGLVGTMAKSGSVDGSGRDGSPLVPGTLRAPLDGDPAADIGIRLVVREIGSERARPAPTART